MARRFASRTHARRKAPRRRLSREGAPAPRSEVRVKPGARRGGRPRASTRPRWPVDAKSQTKKWRWSFSTHRGARAAGWAGARIAGSLSFDGPDDRLPLVVPSAARRHRAVQSKHRARAKRRRVAKASRRAEPQPGLSHSEAAASAKRKRRRQRTAAVIAGVDPATSRRMTGKRNDGPSREFAARSAFDADRRNPL